jgi:Sodium/calcium exchanger protein
LRAFTISLVVIQMGCINNDFRRARRQCILIASRRFLKLSTASLALSHDIRFSCPFLTIFLCSEFSRLPVPWLLYGIIYGEPVEVSSEGMVCSITILFIMLLFVIISIACFRWKMNKLLGLVMFVLYFVFVAISLTFEYEWYKCPL